MGLLDLFRKEKTRKDYETALREKEHGSEVRDRVNELSYDIWGRNASSIATDSPINKINLELAGRAKAYYIQAKKRLDKLYRQQEKEAIQLNREYGALITKLGKDAKEVYAFERKKLGMHRKRDNNGLVAITSIFGIVAGIFFLSPNLTGNVIGNLTNSTSNSIGIVLFIAGIIGTFFYFRKR